MTGADASVVAERVETSAGTPRDTRHVAALDGVRAVAAYTVIATHAGFTTGRALDNGPWAPLLARLNFGVTLFFLLSAFLLFRPFAASALSGGRPPSAGRFWWRRAVRIGPAYWIAVTVTLALLSTRHVSASEWRSYLLLTETYTGHNVEPTLSQMWTLAVEISFYAALPLLALTTRWLFRRGELGGQLALVGAMFVGGLAFDVVTLRHSGGATPALLWLPAYLDWFALGMLLALAHCLPGDGPRWRRVLGDWAAAPGTCWLIGALLFWISTLPLAGPRDLFPPTGWEWMLRHLLFGAAAFFFVLPVMLPSAGWVRAVLGHPVMRWLGTISYGVYLWHLGLLLALQRWLGWQPFTGHFWALYAVTAAAATAAAAASWYLVERPLLRHASRPWRRSAGSVDDEQREREQAAQLGAGAVAERMA